MDDFEGKTLFVTGGASGIGLAIAHAFAAQGARIVLADIDAARAAQEAQAFDGPVMALALDTSDRAAWGAAKAAVAARFGAVDILCNSAGIGSDGSTLAQMDPLSFDRMVRITLTGVYNGIATFAQDMIDRGDGHVVNIASLAGLVHHAHIGAYSAAKAGVIALSETLREEAGSSGVGVTIVCPGRVATRIDETTRAAGSARPDTSQLPAEAALTIQPAVVADMVVAAVRANLPYVITHRSFRALFEARIAPILAAFDRAPV